MSSKKNNYTMKKNMNGISGKSLSQKEMQGIKGGAPLCPHGCMITIPDRSGGYTTVLGGCFYSYPNHACTCEAGGGTYQEVGC
jgi:hypothetical protein